LRQLRGLVCLCHREARLADRRDSGA
jgi:hypothetical protein